MSNFTIEQVLPHGHPMILLDSLTDFSGNEASCSLKITTDNLFFNEALNGVPSYVGIEYMAQTIAAYANANQLINSQKVEIGFLVSSRKYKCSTSVFSIDTQLGVSVKKLYMDDSGLSAFDCTISENNNEIASARINVFQPNNPSEYLAEHL